MSPASLLIAVLVAVLDSTGVWVLAGFRLSVGLGFWLIGVLDLRGVQ